MATPARFLARPERGRGARLDPRRVVTRRSPLVTVAVVLLGIVGLFALLFAASLHAVQGNSDGATVILEGHSMATGNVALGGWRLSLDSFWGIDAPLYMLGVLAVGVCPVLLHAIPALIAALVVALGMAIARTAAPGAGGIAGAVCVFALLAMPSYALAVFFVQGPLHIGTALWCLVAFVLLGREHPGWRLPAAIVVLAAGCLGDAQTLALGVAPVLLGGVVAAARCRRVRAGLAAAVAAAGGVGLALGVRALAAALGSFSIASANATATGAERAHNLRLAFDYGTKLLGLGAHGFGSGGVPGGLEVVHGAGVAAVLAGVVLAAVGLVRGAVRGNARRPGGDGADHAPRWRLDDQLVVAFFADLALFVVLTPVENVSYARYLTAAVIFGAILAGRAVARLAGTLTGRGLRRAGAAVGLALGGALAGAFGVTLTQADASQPTSELAGFLSAHHLHEGIADYWDASIATVESSGATVVRPVVAAPSGRIEAYPRNTERDWYARRSFEFVVDNTRQGFGDIDETSARATFGTPARTYVTGRYRVLVYGHRLAVPLQRP